MLELLPDLCDQHGDALQVAEPLFHDYGGKPLFYGEAVTLSCFVDKHLVPGAVGGDGRAAAGAGAGGARRAVVRHTRPCTTRRVAGGIPP